MTPRISVVIPTHRRNELLIEAVRSAHRQSLRPYEILVVIDEPSPDTVDCLSALTSEITELRWLSVQAKGPGIARNAGVEQATGEWIAFLDDDDTWHETKLEKQMSAISHTGAPALVATKYVSDDSQSGRFVEPRRIANSQEDVGDYLFCRGFELRGETALLTSTLLAPRKFLIARPFSDRKIHEDWEWILRATKLDQLPLLYLNETLAIRRVDRQRERAGSGKPLAWSLDFLEQNRHVLSRQAIRGFLAGHVLPRVLIEFSLKEAFVFIGSRLKKGDLDAKSVSIALIIRLLPPKLKLLMRKIFDLKKTTKP